MPTPLFLYTGAEFGERNDAVAAYRQIVENKFGPCDYHILYASDTSVSDTLAFLQNGSLFSNAKFVVYRNAELIKKKEDISLISDWAESMKKQSNPDSFLFLISDETSVDKKLEAIVPKDQKRVFWEMFENRKEQWLYDFFSKNGYKLDEDGAAVILGMIENNTEALRNECSRFFLCFPKGHIITTDDIESILEHNREESAFTLFDAITDSSKANKTRLENALLILQKIRQSKDSNSVAIIAGLTWCFRKLTVWKELCKKGNPSELDYKIAGFAAKKARNQYRSAASIWTGEEVKRIVALLGETDMLIRASGSTTAETYLENMIFSIILKKGCPFVEFNTI